MAKMVSFAEQAVASLRERRTVAVVLPEFAVRALEYRVEVANTGAQPDEVVDLNDVIEWYLISPLTVKEFPHLEAAVPGFSGAFSRWLFETNYQPPED